MPRGNVQDKNAQVNVWELFRKKRPDRLERAAIVLPGVRDWSLAVLLKAYRSSCEPSFQWASAKSVAAGDCPLTRRDVVRFFFVVCNTNYHRRYQHAITGRDSCGKPVAVLFAVWPASQCTYRVFINSVKTARLSIPTSSRWPARALCSTTAQFSVHMALLLC